MTIFRSFPPDVVVLDSESILHARLQRSGKSPMITAAKSYALPVGTFSGGVITPEPAADSQLGGVLKRMKLESGRLDRASILLPDAWFRMNILELSSLPQNRNEADEMVRWTLKRTLPMKPDEFRIAWEPVGQNGVTRVLVFAAFDKSLRAIEKIFSDAGIEIVLIEPTGINIWNSIVARELASAADAARAFIYVRPRDFTTALFRGATPLFLRSRNLGAERSLIQEIRLSVSYLRTNYEAGNVALCYVAGSSVDDQLANEIAAEFGAPTRRLELRDFAGYQATEDGADIQAELIGCTGVFTN